MVTKVWLSYPCRPTSAEYAVAVSNAASITIVAM